MKKSILLLLLFIGSIQVYSQNFGKGKLYWGVFDADKQNVVGKLELKANLNEIKREGKVFNFNGRDMDGKYLSEICTLKSAEENLCVNEISGSKYLVHFLKNEIFILSPEKLPKGDNWYFMMKIVLE